MIDTRFAGLIFDMDGTLVQSEHLHRESWTAPLAERGVAIDDDTYLLEFAGKPGMQIIREQFDLEGDSALHLYQQVTTAYWELAEDLLHPTRGLLGFLDQIEHLPKAVCTSAQRESAERMLGVLGIMDRFDAVITATDVVHGKPHPEPYLLAARAINCDPARCVAFEDAANGLIAARAAGMFCIGIGEGRKQFPDLADGWIEDFFDPALVRLLG